MPDLADTGRQAGFGDVEVTEEHFDVVIESFDAWWQAQWTHGYRAFLREFDAATLEQMRARAHELLRPLEAPDGSIHGVQTFAFCTARR
jgi:hypothetical protein